MKNVEFLSVRHIVTAKKIKLSRITKNYNTSTVTEKTN